MPNRLDISGERYGRLVAVKRLGLIKNQSVWICKCDCGKEKQVVLGALRSGLTKSCGCYHDEVSGSQNFIDLTGKTFGNWLVLKKAENKKGQHIYWLCRCMCGYEKEVQGNSLRRGLSTCCTSCAYIKIAAKNKNRKVPEKQKRHLSKVRMGRFTGEDNPNWRGGVTPENTSIRCSTEYEEWRIKVFERDRGVCQKCGIKPQIANAHHVKPFYRHPDLRFDIDNGITLCEECHREEHRKPFVEWGQAINA